MLGGGSPQRLILRAGDTTRRTLIILAFASILMIALGAGNAGRDLSGGLVTGFFGVVLGVVSAGYLTNEVSVGLSDVRIRQFMRTRTITREVITGTEIRPLRGVNASSTVFLLTEGGPIPLRIVAERSTAQGRNKLAGVERAVRLALKLP